MFNNPKINIDGATNVAVDPIFTIDGLAAIAVKFGNLVQAEPAATICKLATCVGELSSAAINGDEVSDETFADKIAAVLLAASVVAANAEIEGFEIRRALVRVVESESRKAVKSSILSMFEDRGMTNALN